jgi:hypothetical protein
MSKSHQNLNIHFKAQEIPKFNLKQLNCSEEPLPPIKSKIARYSYLKTGPNFLSSKPPKGPSTSLVAQTLHQLSHPSTQPSVNSSIQDILADNRRLMKSLA